MIQTLVIIGGGPAGEAAAKTARKLSQLGSLPEINKDLQIILIEKEELGGLCLNKGCIPSKTLLEKIHSNTSHSEPVSWPEIQKFKTQVVTTLRSHLENSLKTLKVKTIKGTAQFENQTTLSVNGEKINFDRAVVCTGTEIMFPPPFDAVKDQILNSDLILKIEKTPESIVIVGGGAVGCEFACLLQAAGSQVTIVEMTAGLLPGEDAAVVSALTRSFESRGIKIKTNVKVTEVKKSSTGWSLKLSDGEFLESSDLLLCAGRYANLKSLALDKAGIKFEKNILVNEKLQTSNSAVYAAGDAAGTRLAHAASQQAEAAVTNALGGSKILDDRFIPRCLYSWPEVASVGAWKYQMDEKNIPSKASRGFFQATAKALASGDTEGFVQIVFNPESRQIQGAQIIGPHATELIHVFSVALKKDCTIDDLADMVFAHPTLSEAIKEAARK